MDEFILNRGSYLAIFLLLVLTGAGLPVPEEIVIVAAGVASSRSVGGLDPPLALATCIAGAVVGDCLVYWIGRGLGRAYLQRHPWFAHLLHAGRFAQFEPIVRQHGLKVLLLARFLVGIRAPIYLAMGMLRSDFRLFLVCDAACGTLVVGIFFLTSSHFGGWIGELIRDSQAAVTFIVLVALMLAGLYWLACKQCRQQLRLDQSSPGDSPDVADAP